MESWADGRKGLHLIITKSDEYLVRSKPVLSLKGQKLTQAEVPVHAYSRALCSLKKAILKHSKEIKDIWIPNCHEYAMKDACRCTAFPEEQNLQSSSLQLNKREPCLDLMKYCRAHICAAYVRL